MKKFKYPAEQNHDQEISSLAIEIVNNDVEAYNLFHAPKKKSTTDNWDRRYMHYINVLVQFLFRREYGVGGTRAEGVAFYVEKNMIHLKDDSIQRGRVIRLLSEGL